MTKRPHQHDDTDSGDGFLTRWSKLKDQAGKGEIPEPPEQQIQEQPETEDVEPVKRDEDMPPIDSLDENSDVRDFFSPGVSEALRKAALRKFFHSPGFNIVDGLDDYDDDFRSFQALGDIITADMRHQMELKEQRQREMEEAAEETTEVAENEKETEDRLPDDLDEPVVDKESTPSNAGDEPDTAEPEADESLNPSDKIAHAKDASHNDNTG